MIETAYILLGLAPAVIWLFYYSKQDLHPEPKKEIFKTFVKGALAAAVAGGIETVLIKKFNIVSHRTFFFSTLSFVLIATIEEVLKYISALVGMNSMSQIDEPIDLPEYMIAAAMGFASLENIILFFVKELTFLDTFFVSGFRFIGATLLHALASGILGFFIAQSFIDKKRQRTNRSRVSLLMGFVLSILLHTLYNFSIIRMEGHIVFPFLVISGGALILSILLQRLKKIKGICYE